MAVLVHPGSELIRDPRLLVPGMAPLSLCRVDLRNPLTNGILDAVLAHKDGGLYSALSGRLSINAGAKGEVDVAMPGVAYRTKTASSATNYDTLIAPRSMVVGTGRITIFAHCLIRNTVAGTSGSNYNGGRHIYSFSPTLDNFTGIGIGRGNNNIDVYGSFGANRYGAGVIGDVLIPTMVFAWHDPDGNYKYQQVGGAVGTVAGGTTTPSTTPTTCGSQTGCFLSTSAPGDKSLFFGCAWNRALTQTERAAIFADPYQFLTHI